MIVIHFLSFISLSIFGFFISLLPYSILNRIGNISGSAAYYLHRNFRKKAMSNLAIAYGKSLSESERRNIAKKSFQNIMITLLELFRLKRSRGKISELVTLKDNFEVERLLKNQQGVIFLTAHQANWEIPFIAVTARFPGIAIGRPIKNKWLYKWILSVREMHGGKIVLPRNAIRRGLKALKEGKFLGIVGDQAFPESSYSYPLLGTRAWTTSTPALLAYKAKCPLVVCTTKRIGCHYEVEASDPLWPDLTKPIKDEVVALMDRSMRILEASIQEQPHQWMWIHDRWKQHGVDYVKRKYRYSFILIILPPNPDHFLDMISTFRKIYPRSFLTIFVPQDKRDQVCLKITDEIEDFELLTYQTKKDLFIRDWRFQLIFDFYDLPKLRHYFLKLGAFHAFSLSDLKGLSPMQTELKEIIRHTLVKPECLQDVIL